MKLRLFLLVGVTIATSYILFHPRPDSFSAQATKQRVPSCCGSQHPVGPREVDFPYYNLTNGWISTLNLVSDSPQPLDFALLIKGKLGQVLTAPETIQSRAKLALDLGTLITQFGGDPTGAFAEGSVAVQFTGTIMPLVGQITMVNPALSLSSESVMVERDPGRSDVPAVLNGIWWGLAGRQGRVMVSNVSALPQTAQVILDFQGQRHPLPTPFTFVPYETKVLDISQLLTSVGFTAAQVPEGGISIIQTGPLPSLIANGQIADPVTGFSSTIDFPSPAEEQASALHADGLPVGTPSKDSPFAGAGTFVPHVLVRNLTDLPETVNITIEYPQPPPTGSGSNTGQAPSTGAQAPMHVNPGPVLPGDANHHPEWGTGAGGTVGTAALASLPVGPYSSVDYSLAAILSQLPLPLPFCSVRIQYSGAPGTMQSQVTSVEARGNLVVDSHVQNEGNGWAGSGANPWHLDANTESVVFLTNESDQLARIGFAVTANDLPNAVPAAEGTHYYLTELRLNPRETRMINLRQLRDAQVPDYKGHLLPANATDGSVTWNRIDNAAVMGRLMVINRQGGLASNYDCCTNYCPNILLADSGDMSPDTASFGVGDGQQYEFTVTYEDQNLDQFPWNVTDYSAWSSQYTSVATVNSTALAMGFGPGTTTIASVDTDCGIYAQNYYGGPCTCQQNNFASGSGPANVTPTVTVTCTRWDLALGEGPPDSTQGTCTATGNPGGGTYSWSEYSDSDALAVSGVNTAELTYSSLNASLYSGDTHPEVTYTMNLQSAIQDSRDMTVHKPTSLTVISDTQQNGTQTESVSCAGSYTCPDAYGTCSCTYGSGLCSQTSPLYQRFYAVLDQFGHRFDEVGISDATIAESLTSVSSTCCADNPTLGSATSSVFGDQFVILNACCFSGQPGCGEAIGQTTTANGFTVRTDTISKTCTGASVAP